MDQPRIIRKVSLAVFKDKKMLVVRPKANPEVFYCLGGTVEKGESDVECLLREVKEEVGCEVDKGSLKFLAEFEDLAHGRENTLVNIRLFAGSLIGEPIPDSEIVEIDYFNSKVNPAKLSAIAINKMFPWLKEKGYIS